MKFKFLVTLFIISLFINLTVAWNYINYIQLFNNNLNSSFNLIKSNVIGAKENLSQAYKSKTNPKQVYLNLYRTNRRLRLTYQEVSNIAPIVRARYFIDISQLVSYISQLQDQLAILQEKLIETGFSTTDFEDQQKLKNLFKKIEKLDNILKNKDLSRQDLSQILQELKKN